jgi:hypothetical protein
LHVFHRMPRTRLVSMPPDYIQFFLFAWPCCLWQDLGKNCNASQSSGGDKLKCG